MKTENTIAKILKIGSIIMFGLCILGSILMSEIETIDYSYLYDDFSFNDDNSPDVKKEFDSNIFIKNLITSAIGCGLIFAFGEMIEVAYQGNKKLDDIKKALESQKEPTDKRG